ncbi:MAG: hypothetical protein ACJ74O_01665 [Frankiaceae bacterium]
MAGITPDDAPPAGHDVASELAELRAAVVELTATLRRMEERTVRVERAVAERPAGPTRPPARAGRRARERPGRRTGQGRHRRHGARPRHAHRSTQLRHAAAVTMVMLPWVLCFACFAAAIGLIAVSTFA